MGSDVNIQSVAKPFETQPLTKFKITTDLIIPASPWMTSTRLPLSGGMLNRYDDSPLSDIASDLGLRPIRTVELMRGENLHTSMHDNHSPAPFVPVGIGKKKR